MRRLTLALLLLMGLTICLSAQAVTLPTTFIASGSAISAGQMKALLDQIVAAVNNQVAPVGTIIASTMTQTQMNAQCGTGLWVLADGSTAPGTYSAATGQANLPDLRGRFLRGMNVSGGTDPDTRTVGSPQTDALQAHRHDLVFTPGGTGGALGIAVGTSGGTISQTGYSGWAGDGRFATETRPTNVAVYWYIKVK